MTYTLILIIFHNYFTFKKINMRRAPNLLILKDDIGKARPSTRELPHPEFTYGLPGPTDEEGVGKCKYCKFFNNNP